MNRSTLDYASPSRPAATPAEGRRFSDAELQLSLAVELGNIALWRHDLRTGRVHFNARGWEMIGVAPRPEGLTLEETRAPLHPDDLPLVLDSVKRSLREPQPVDTEARLRHADGHWLHVMTRRSVERGPDGQPVAFIGVSLDVTDRVGEARRAEAISRRFELLTGAAGIGYWQFEDDEPRPFWSEPLRALHGLAPGEAVPTFVEWLRDWVHPADRETAWRQFDEWRRSDREDLSASLRLVRRDGQVRHLAAHARAGAPPQRCLQYGLVIDLTERRAAEMALRSATERAALAAHGVGLGTWELDLETNEALWDAQMWRLRGRPPRGDAMNEPERLACVHPEDQARTLDRMHAAEAAGQTLEHEFRVVWPDGQVRWLASRSVEWADEKTGARRRFGVNWDITELRAAEQARQEREIARRESQAKSQFLARMSHELRTPLNAILGFAQLMQEKELGGDASSVERRLHLGHIRSAGRHLLSLINDALDLSALQGGELRIDLQPVALAPLVAQALPLIGPLDRPSPSGPPVRVHVGELGQQVMADTVRLRQVLINLLNNAVKFNRPGGQVWVEAETLDGEVLLRVRDNGLGMSEAQLGRLFEPFSRLGAEAGGVFGQVAVEGSGIGLAIVKALVEGMGGSVHARSALGVGTVFELRLQAANALPAEPPGATASAPRATTTGAPPGEGPPIAPSPAPAAGPGPARPRRQVLYVEDNPVNALIVGELLARRPDVQLHLAVDGTTGLAQATALCPDLILLDMQLPDFDGFEVLRRLRAQPRTAHIPCIAVSANAMPQDIERAMQAGMADYWTKPLDLQAFMAALDALFDAPG